MKCQVATHFPNTTKFPCGVSEYIHGKPTSPDPYKTAWAGAEQLRNASGVKAIGAAFTQNQCRTSFLVVNQTFDLVTDSDSVFLLAIVPRNKKGGACKTATSKPDIEDMASILLREAMERDMVAFCLTLTGQPGWFGSNNWYGQVKVYPLVDSGSVGSIPCLGYIV